MKKRFLAALALTLCGSLVYAQNLVKYVDPFIGTGGHGHTYPGATVPFGMVQLSPDNGTEGWDWCSGYNYIDSTIAGFSHMHLSGTGCGDWTDISVMPATELIDDSTRYYRVRFSHSDEKATPGFYSVELHNGIKVALTATERCGMHQYTFPKGCDAVLRFQLSYMINYDSATRTRIRMLNDSTIVGYRESKGWANKQKVFFAARTSKKISKFYAFDNYNHKQVNQDDETGYVYNGELVFKGLDGKPLLMKVGLSTVSEEMAELALKEIKGWSFDAVKNSAAQKWERELQMVQVKIKDDQAKKVFYTALYHTCMAPVLYSDADGRYRNAKGELHKMERGQRYTVFSLWDTYRALCPLFTVLQTERNTDILNSMLAFHDENGLLPVWDLGTWETDCMGGSNSLPVLADAILKNTPGLDAEKAYYAMRRTAFQSVRATPHFLNYGYVPQDKSGYSTSYSLEYGFDYWCLAQAAKKLGKMDDYKSFMKKSLAYKLLFDTATGFIHAKNSDGSWTKPFNPYFMSVNWTNSMFEEGNAWQYTFSVPHDVRGLAKLFGGHDRFTEKLDALFIAKTNLATFNEAPPDVSGLIGQYAHGNEPSHHIAYMYSFIGQPWKTQQMVRYITDSMYHAAPDGYAGNEDCGQMSAWAVWSMMGMYPANSASGEYVFGSPMFDEAAMKLPAGKKMIVRTKNNAKDHPYIQSVKLNGKTYDKVYIDHATLMKGGVLEFVMGDQPNKNWGVKEESWPSSAN